MRHLRDVFKDARSQAAAARRRVARLRNSSTRACALTPTAVAELEDWQRDALREAERMLGASRRPTTRPTSCCASSAARSASSDTYAKTRVGVFFGTPGETVADPFFGGAGPDADRLHALRALHGRLPARREEHARQELPVARRARGRAVEPERTVVDIRPLGAPDGRRLRGDDRALRRVAAARPARADRPRRRRRGRRARHQPAARSAAGCDGSLPRISDRLGELVRTNSRGDPRGHAAARTRRRHDQARRDHRRASTPTRTRTSRPSSTATPATR